MRTAYLLTHVIRPGLDLLQRVTGKPVASPEAEVLLLAMALQESGGRHRRQVAGPARGWWQFERSGGTNGVLTHHATRPLITSFLTEINIPTDLDSVWDAMPNSELLQVAMARLLLWSDPKPLPRVGEHAEAWAFYLRNWRPGKPGQGRWDANYTEAVVTVRENPIGAPGAAVDPEALNTATTLAVVRVLRNLADALEADA